MPKVGLMLIDDDGSHHLIAAEDADRVAAQYGGSGATVAAPQTLFGIDPIRLARCIAACKSKKGFGACVARCVATGQVCDGGVSNCSSL